MSFVIVIVRATDEEGDAYWRVRLDKIAGGKRTSLNYGLPFTRREEASACGEGMRLALKATSDEPVTWDAKCA